MAYLSLPNDFLRHRRHHRFRRHCRTLPLFALCDHFIGNRYFNLSRSLVTGFGPGGWLGNMGFKDFAGSAVVHMVGGAVGLAGIQVLGARLGRFDKDGKPRQIPASSMPQVALGVIILTFGWIGFNGGSATFGEDTPVIV